MAVDERYKAIVIGASAGGLAAISVLVKDVQPSFHLPIIVVQHRLRMQNYILEEVLQTKCHLHVKQADEKEPIVSGIMYVAPPDYHLLIETDHTFSLSSDPLVSFSRPSIDVTFESAAVAYGPSLIGILLTGANKDGAAGLLAIKKSGGLTIAQQPDEAEYPYMPQAAVDINATMQVLRLEDIQRTIFA